MFHRSLLFLAVTLYLNLSVTGAENHLSATGVKLLSERGSTRATRYATANKIVTLGRKTHVAWLDSISRTMVASFDRESQSWSQPVHVGEGTDNHGGPALTCDSGGFLHIIFGPHAGEPFQHSRSARPNDSTEWVRLPRFGVHPTYPSLVCDPDDTLHLVYRGGKERRQRNRKRSFFAPRHHSKWSMSFVTAPASPGLLSDETPG